MFKYSFHALFYIISYSFAQKHFKDDGILIASFASSADQNNPLSVNDTSSSISNKTEEVTYPGYDFSDTNSTVNDDLDNEDIVNEESCFHISILILKLKYDQIREKREALRKSFLEDGMEDNVTATTLNSTYEKLLKLEERAHNYVKCMASHDGWTMAFWHKLTTIYYRMMVSETKIKVFDQISKYLEFSLENPKDLGKITLQYERVQIYQQYLDMYEQTTLRNSTINRITEQERTV